jgi:hypothetical protein
MPNALAMPSHLHNYHKIRSSFCKGMISQYENLPMSQTDNQVVDVPAESPPLEFLASLEQGCFCSWEVLLLLLRKAEC